VLTTDDTVDQLLGAEVYLGVDAHTREDGRLTVSAVAMTRKRKFVAVQTGGTDGLIHWLRRPAHREHVKFTKIAVDMTRAGALIERDLKHAGFTRIQGLQLADMAMASLAFSVDLADEKFRPADRHAGSDALDEAVSLARRKPLGDETAGRYVFTTYSKDNDLSPLIALVLANHLAANPRPDPVMEWGVAPFSGGRSGPDIQQVGGRMFPTYTTDEDRP